MPGGTLTTVCQELWQLCNYANRQDEPKALYSAHVFPYERVLHLWVSRSFQVDPVLIRLDDFLKVGV